MPDPRWRTGACSHMCTRVLSGRLCQYGIRGAVAAWKGGGHKRSELGNQPVARRSHLSCPRLPSLDPLALIGPRRDGYQEAWRE